MNELIEFVWFALASASMTPLAFFLPCLPCCQPEEPEEPEECFCPSMCRYYWVWGGHSSIASSTVRHGCNFIDESRTESLLAYGIVTSPTTGFGDLETTQQVVYVPSTDAFETGTLFQFEHRVRGATTYTDIASEVGITTDSPLAEHYTRLTATAAPKCSVQIEQKQWHIRFSVLQEIKIATSFTDEKATIVTLYRKYVYVDVAVAGACINSELLACPTESAGSPSLHLADDVAVAYGLTGVTINGTLYPWVTGDPSDVDLGYTQWHVANEYPLSSASVSLLAAQSCLPPQAVILTEGSSYEVPDGVTTIKAWAIGSGGVGERGRTAPSGGSGFIYGNLPGNAGAVAYRTWTSVGGSVSYSVGAARSNASPGAGNATTVTYDGVTITANGGTYDMGTAVDAPKFPNNYVGASFSGGDGGATGGRGDSGGWGNFGQSGGAIAGNGVRQACGRYPATDVSGLLEAVALAGGKADETCDATPAVGSGGASDKFEVALAAGYGGGGVRESSGLSIDGVDSGSGAVVLLFEYA